MVNKSLDGRTPYLVLSHSFIYIYTVTVLMTRDGLNDLFDLFTLELSNIAKILS